MLLNECTGRFIPLNFPSLQDRACDSCNDDMCVQQIFDIKFRNRQNAGVIMPHGNLSGNIYIIKRDASGAPTASLRSWYGDYRDNWLPPFPACCIWFILIQPDSGYNNVFKYKKSLTGWRPRLIILWKDTYRVSVVQTVHSLYPVWSLGTHSCLHQAQLRP